MFAVIFSWLIGVVLAADVHVSWDVSFQNVSRDGFSMHLATVVNGKLPIPPVYVDQGDTLHLHVQNSLPHPLSIHAHGLFQRNTTYYDGTGMITECGIPPGHSFTYKIHTTDQTGMFWLHGHHEFELPDGLRVPFIVRKKSLWEVDEDILITLEDWLQMEFMEKTRLIDQMPSKLLDHNYPSVLINGINGNLTQPIRFVPGKRYRLRVISMSSTYWFRFRIPGHLMRIVEADGIDSKPAAVEGLDMCPGQRYSVLVDALDTAKYNYNINVTFFANFVERAPNVNPRYYHIPLEYRESAPVKQYPIKEDHQVKWSSEFDLQPQDKQEILEPIDRQIVLGEKEYGPEVGLPFYAFGNYAFNHSIQVPALMTALSMGDLAMDPRVYGPQANAQVVRHMENVELVLNNTNARDHSFHLHGHVFQVVELGCAVQDRRLCSSRTRRSLKWPMRRDTVTLPMHHYIKVRFKADNPGTFMGQCHQEQHLYKGLAFVLVEAPDVLQKTLKVPQAILDHCRILGRKTQGNAAGNWGFNMTGLPQATLVVNSI
ncbi:ferroxidase fet3 [Coemansia sp. RSA 989]|nr:ferroxidase fet3 [Coemansia sp. RSA 1086]KAJ1751881.1 ferroxidase fet3 [Coemansia sp. RSA 1821]KAJ1865524.1 ferroxidase fet3 [Coemansia sp. RSA 989]